MSGREKLAGARPLFIAALLLAGCYSGPATSDTLRLPARVQQVEVVVMESVPVQANAVVRGYLPDGCSKVADIGQARDGSLFRVSIMTTRPADVMCTAVIRDFERSIPLDVAGLPAGGYMVDVNGVRASFRLP